MGELKIKLPNELEMVFRRSAMQRFGFSKGSISKAAKEAIVEWTEETGTNQTENFDELKGMLKNTKKTSVELQHEAFDSIRKKHVNRR